MSRRAHAEHRCPACHMHQVLCICALIPQLHTRSRLLLLLHKSEEQKTTNTGQLAARALVGSDVVVIGDLARPLPVPLVPDERQPLLLFPDDDAVPLTHYAHSDTPVTLVVPDGNWRQASKMRARVPGLATMPCVSLPEGGPTIYRLRSEPREGGLATLEAIARAFAVLEGDDVAHALLDVFRVMVERTLWTRGALRDEQVHGGIPAAARLHDPRAGQFAPKS
jgi:DTW domain-containing protein YfiP